MEDPLELLKQKFFNKQLSKSEQLLFTEALELDDDFADAVAEELHWREIQFLATHKQMDAETLQKADFRIVVPTTILKSETPFVLEESPKIAQNTKSWSKVTKYAAAAMLSSVVLFVGWKQWMPKDSIPKKELIAIPSKVPEIPVVRIDSPAKFIQSPSIEAKPALQQNSKKVIQDNPFIVTNTPNLNVETIDNQTINEPTPKISSIEKESLPVTKVDNPSVTKGNLVQMAYFNIEMKPILEELYNPSAGKSVLKKTDWYAAYKKLIHDKQADETDLVALQHLLAEAQKTFKDVQPNQLEDKEISPNQVFAFMMLNLSVLPLKEQQKQDLKLWWSYRKYNLQQESILLRCEKMYEAMMAEK